MRFQKALPMELDLNSNVSYSSVDNFELNAVLPVFEANINDFFANERPVRKLSIQ